MVIRSNARPMLTIAAVAFSGLLSMTPRGAAQQAAPAPPAAAPAVQPAAPIERQPPSDADMGPGMGRGGPGVRGGMRPGMGSGMRPGRQPGMGQGTPQGMREGHGAPANFRGAGMMAGHGHGEPGFRGGPGVGFHGPQGEGMGGGFHIAPPGMWWKNPMVVQRLTLTPEQAKRMDDIFQKSRIELIDLKANLEKQDVLLEPMLSANPADTAKAMMQIDRVAQARADLEKADARMLLGIRGVLTPDQWTKLNTRAGGWQGGAAAAAAPAPAAPAPGGPAGRPRRPRGGAPAPAAPQP